MACNYTPGEKPVTGVFYQIVKVVIEVGMVGVKTGTLPYLTYKFTDAQEEIYRI